MGPLDLSCDMFEMRSFLLHQRAQESFPPHNFKRAWITLDLSDKSDI